MMPPVARPSPPRGEDELVELLPQRFHIGIGKWGIQRAHRIAVVARAADGGRKLRVGHFTRRPLRALHPLRAGVALRTARALHSLRAGIALRPWRTAERTLRPLIALNALRALRT